MKGKADVSDTDLVLKVQQSSTKTGITHSQMLAKTSYSTEKSWKSRFKLEFN